MMIEVPAYDEVINDDGALLLDRLVRGLYRNKDGFLAPDERNPKHHVDDLHNAVCLYIYAEDVDGFYTLNMYYVYGGRDPHTYDDWRDIAFDAVDELNKQAEEKRYGIYGWSTTTIHVTPIRTGDLFIAIDEKGVRGVRISFDTRKAKRASHKG